MSKTVGVLGSGQVAQVLARGFAQHGYQVRIGSRDPAKLSAFAEGCGGAVQADTFAGAAAFGALVVLAVKGTAALEALKLAGAEALHGKVVIDTTNPIADEPPQNGVLRYFTDANESLMERLQAAFPAARLVKAWNSVGNGFMVNPKLPGGPPTMFICGNDAAAKAEVSAILGVFGWDSEDVGLVESARPVEALCQLWCAPGFQRNQWAHAYKVLKP